MVCRLQHNRYPQASAGLQLVTTTMKKVLLILTMLLPVAACAQVHADVWLQHQLSRYFADSVSMQELTTERYAAFKTDAMNMGLNGGIDYSTFQKRWSRVYDIHQPHLHEAFLVPLQDWNAITVSCELLPSSNGQVWVGADITESSRGLTFRRDIQLVLQNGDWRIDDVHCVEPLHQCIIGDFNGDRKADTLCASLTSLVSRQPVLVDTLLDYDTLIARVVKQQPLLQLAANSTDTLLLNKGMPYVLGLHYLENIGNIDKRPGEEVAVVIWAADWSSRNLYKVYTYTPKGWKLLWEKEISEEQLKPKK